VKGKRWK